MCPELPRDAAVQVHAQTINIRQVVFFRNQTKNGDTNTIIVSSLFYFVPYSLLNILYLYRSVRCSSFNILYFYLAALAACPLFFTFTFHQFAAPSTYFTFTVLYVAAR